MILRIRDIEELYNIKYDEESDFESDYPLPRWYHKVRNYALTELDDSDVSRCVRQEIFLEYTVPEALKRLELEPLCGSYDGQMIFTFLNLDENCWMNNKDLIEEAYLKIAQARTKISKMSIGFDEGLVDEEDKVDKIRMCDALLEKLQQIRLQD
ncbi:contact-dependent growth inhibition system immunity protein [Mechercharimyces sp. CAU 1602]|uniref:contact-dependent growth inhibition system immunity protein n=1 Tax=Mechercharimyces sp. CAU 1602 TaxID=2973933 RepID=UPI00216218AF|nr:contact-dependent growth inhibition system immunity protein [Mechercharimyces sp. CAU 1602]MCS1350879.1 contact-dependent growth inhibition system immunity protein [Mechercharimyces sp. CAU 1602]